MMDNRNNTPLFGGMPGYNPRGMGYRPTFSDSLDGDMNQDSPGVGGRFLALEPEDYDNGPVPIADPASTPRVGESMDMPSGTREIMMRGLPLAMVYVPEQDFDGLYGNEEALSAGTLFKALDFPFCPGCRKSGRMV